MKHKIFTLIMLLSIVPLGASELKKTMQSHALTEEQKKQVIFLDIPRERSRSRDRRRSRSRDRSLSVEIARATGKCLSLAAVLAKVAMVIAKLVGTCIQ